MPKYVQICLSGVVALRHPSAPFGKLRVTILRVTILRVTTPGAFLVSPHPEHAEGFLSLWLTIHHTVYEESSIKNI
jgi:hypothetical protein